MNMVPPAEQPRWRVPAFYCSFGSSSILWFTFWYYPWFVPCVVFSSWFFLPGERARSYAGRARCLWRCSACCYGCCGRYTFLYLVAVFNDAWRYLPPAVRNMGRFFVTNLRLVYQRLDADSGPVGLPSPRVVLCCDELRQRTLVMTYVRLLDAACSA